MPKVYDPEQLNEAEESAPVNSANPSASQTKPGKISYNTGLPKPTSPGESSSSTAPGKSLYNSSPKIPDEEKSFYKSSSNSSSTAPGKVRFGNLLGTRRRKIIFGTGGISTIAGIVLLFSFMSGPLQFVHIAQLLTQFHLSAGQDTADDRFSKIGRYIYYGNARNTRLGVLGNKWANQIEGNLGKNGIETAYTGHFDYFNGYVIDPEKNPDLKGKSKAEVKKYFNDEYGITLHDGPDGKLLASADNLGYFKQRKLIKNMLTEAGYSKISAAVQSRIMGKRAGINWHPIKKLDNKILKTVDERLTKWRESRTQNLENGEQNDISTRVSPTDNPDETAAQRAAREGQATGSASEANSVISDGQTVNTEAAKGNTGAISAFQDHLSVKVAAGGTALAGVLCVAKGLDENAAVIKHTQVVLPLMRMGMEVITLGNQVMSGQDVDMEQLGFYAKQLSDKDTSWLQADSIQSELGNTKTGNDNTKADRTLTTINKDSPFHFLQEGALGSVMKAACGKIGTGIQTVVGFLGGPISALAGYVGGAVLGPPVMNAMAHWIAGKAVDVAATGASFGNDINYGTKLAANDQQIAAGGRALSNKEVAELNNVENSASRNEFQAKSTAYKLFSPSDYRSVVSRVIDSQSSSASKNLENFASIFSNFAGLFGKIRLPSLSTASAASSYDYGFPTYGFSTEELNNSNMENPFENGDKAASILSGSDGSKYIAKAQTCFGVTIDNSTGVWDVTGGSDVPTYSKIDGGDCGDSSPEWLSIRFFILDTQVMESSACYEGDDQACSDVGFDTSSSAATTSATSETIAVTTIDMSHLYDSSTSVACADGTKDAGIQTGYHDGAPVQIRLCAIPGLPSSGEESTNGSPYYISGTDGLAVVNSRVSGAFLQLVMVAKRSGINMYANSSFRTMAHQQALCQANAGCRAGNHAEVAAPGTSNHQMGIAIDFGTSGHALISSGDQWFSWLSANASKFGIKNYPAENWHWSPTGN